MESEGVLTESQWRESRIAEAMREDDTLTRGEAEYGLTRDTYLDYAVDALASGAAASYAVARCLAKDGALPGLFRRHASQFPTYCCAVTGKELPRGLA